MLEVEKYRNICEILIVGKEHDVKAVQESRDVDAGRDQLRDRPRQAPGAEESARKSAITTATATCRPRTKSGRHNNRFHHRDTEDTEKSLSVSSVSLWFKTVGVR